jgi:hypothetical protein
VIFLKDFLQINLLIFGNKNLRNENGRSVMKLVSRIRLHLRRFICPAAPVAPTQNSNSPQPAVPC